MSGQAQTPPTPEQEQRAKWDLLLADIEYRQEQLRLARRDSEYRQDQMSQARQDMWFKPWQVAFAGMTAGAALFAAGAAAVKLFG